MSTLTVANIENELVRKVGPLMAIVGLDGTTRTGANRDLRQPIRSALRALGFDCTDAVAVTDSDVSVVSGYYVERLIDLALLTIYADVMRLWIAAIQSPPPPLTKEDMIKLRADMKVEVDRLTKVVEQPIRSRSSSSLGYIGGRNNQPANIPNTPSVSDWRGWPLY